MRADDAVELKIWMTDEAKDLRGKVEPLPARQQISKARFNGNGDRPQPFDPERFTRSDAREDSARDKEARPSPGKRSDATPPLMIYPSANAGAQAC